MRIVLSGGGTGGHITPLVATAQAIKQQNKTAELFYIGDKGALGAYPEMRILFKAEYGVVSGKLRRYSDESWLKQSLNIKRLLLNLIDIGKVKLGVFQALIRLKRLKPDAVFIKGGYVGLPVGLAAAMLRLPIVLHESDARLGLTNRVLARFAQTVAVSFPLKQYPQVSKEKLQETGNPVRAEIRRVGDKKSAQESLNLNNTQPVVLIMGGSQGAKAINDAVLNNLKPLTDKYQLIHITGSHDYPRVARLATGQNIKQENYRLYQFINNIAEVYVASDAVVARAGMNTVAELAAVGLAAIIVPAPHLGDQLKNAQFLKQRKAALVLEESKLNLQLNSSLKKVTQAKRKKTLQEKISKLNSPDAAQKLAKLIVQSAKNG